MLNLDNYSQNCYIKDQERIFETLFLSNTVRIKNFLSTLKKKFFYGKNPINLQYIQHYYIHDRGDTNTPNRRFHSSKSCFLFFFSQRWLLILDGRKQESLPTEFTADNNRMNSSFKRRIYREWHRNNRGSIRTRRTVPDHFHSLRTAAAAVPTGVHVTNRVYKVLQEKRNVSKYVSEILPLDNWRPRFNRTI